MSKVMDALRDAVVRSGESRADIARRSGVAESQLSRLVHGQRDLSVATAETLAAALGLEVVVRPRATRKRKG